MMSKEHPITIIGTLPPVKGISPYCLELLSALTQQTSVEFIGFTKLYPDFIYPGGKVNEDQSVQLNIKDAKIRNILTYYNPLTWIWAGMTCKGDVVHAQWWSHVLAPIYVTILALSKVRGKKIVITVHNVLPHETSSLNRFLNKIVLFFGDHYIVHSKRNISEMQTVLNIPKERITQIPHGILSSYCTDLVSQDVARDKMRLPKAAKIILFYGTIRDYKGLDVLIKALAKIIEKNTSVHLVIAGSPWKDWEYYEQLIQNYNIQDHVTKILKFIPSEETKYYYISADLVVLPYKEFSSQSGVGSVALAFGKPLLVTDVGGLTEYVKDERCVVEPNNPEALAEGILNIFETEGLLLKLSSDSKQLAECLSWDVIAQVTISLYRKLKGGD